MMNKFSKSPLLKTLAFSLMIIGSDYSSAGISLTGVVQWVILSSLPAFGYSQYNNITSSSTPTPTNSMAYNSSMTYNNMTTTPSATTTNNGMSLLPSALVLTASAVYAVNQVGPPVIRKATDLLNMGMEKITNIFSTDPMSETLNKEEF